MIDLRKARVFRCGHDSLGVTNSAWSHIARVNQDRLTRGGHEEHRIAALNIDNVDVQGR